jgi:hypothetical protein
MRKIVGRGDSNMIAKAYWGEELKFATSLKFYLL